MRNKILIYIDFLRIFAYNINADMNLLRGNALIIWAGRKTRVHQTAGKTPAIFVLWRQNEGTKHICR